MTVSRWVILIGKRRLAILILGAVASILCGCASQSKEAVELKPTPRPLGADLVEAAPPEPTDHTEPPAVVAEPSGALSLSEALSLALMKNPRLSAFSIGVRAAEARMLQAKLWPNPELEAEIEDFGGSGAVSGFDGAEETYALSQRILTARKIKKRTEVSRLDAQLAGWDYETVRVDVFTAVTKAFVDVLASQERVETAKEALNLAEKVYDTVSKQVESGAISPIEQTRTLVELSNSRIDLRNAQSALQGARAALSAMWRSTDPRFTSVGGELEVTAPVPTFQAMASLLKQNPDVARWATEMAAQEARLTLARAGAYPDLTLRGGLRRFRIDGAGSDRVSAAVASVSIPLPLFNQNQGAIREAEHNVRRTEALQASTEASAWAQLKSGHERLLAASAEVRTLSVESLPAAQTAFDAVSKGYIEGKFNYLDVLDAQRTLVATRFRYIDALAAFHRWVADVERLIGEPLSDVKEPAQ